MAFLTQNMNQFAQTPILGGVELIPTPNVVSVQILPTSTATYIQQTSALKLTTGTSAAILVDVQTGPTDAAVFGIIPYNDRQNLYKPGALVECVRSGYMWFRSSAAIARGDTVALTAATSTSDPLVTTDTTSGHYVIGIAIDVATAADQLIRVSISPAKNP